MTFPQAISINLPDWIPQVVSPGDVIASEEERMNIAIQLSEWQLTEGTGGPFGAIVCEMVSGKVVGVGVNRVLHEHASIAHAEVLAWSSAQSHFDTYDLAAEGIPRLALYSSAQPCIACWGGLFWTGLTRLVCAAKLQDVMELAGFDEGPVPENWDTLLRQSNIEVEQDLCREAACKVLERYGHDGVIYNPTARASNSTPAGE